MKIEFDPKKPQSNLKKHGVSFDAASAALLDPIALVIDDPDAEGEVRFLLIGTSDLGLLIVCYTLRDEETIRLISACKATIKEKKFMRKEYDFSNAKRAKDVPALAKLQAKMAGKTRITMRVDNAVLNAFKARAEASDGNYQTMMNEALSQYSQGLSLADVVRETIRKELHAA